MSRNLPSLSWFLGSPSDWQIPKLRRALTTVPRLRINASWIGVLTIVATVAGSWFAFANVQVSEGAPITTAFSLWVGAVSILLMAWSFVLAIRIKWLENIFGGLDGIYKVHRWAGTAAVVAMFAHTHIGPEVNGIMGASEAVAEAAEELAGVGEIMIYVLLAATLLRLLPYRWWRWTHKAFGFPYLMACWHFVTIEKPYDNFSAWGLFFGSAMAVGAAAWVWRLFVRDAGIGSRDFVITAAEHEGRLTTITMRPKAASRPLGHYSGQFAFLKLKTGGTLSADNMSEPHPFTIASSPYRPGGELEFVIAHLGDWSAKLPELDLVGVTTKVEGPYGHFQPRPKDPARPTLWVAGGVGITPFLAAIDELLLTPFDDRFNRGDALPTLIYCTPDASSDPMMDRLRAAEEASALRLGVFDRSTGRLTVKRLDILFPDGLEGYHVAVCGPESLVIDMADAAYRRGAATVQSEDFDMRQGFGPERSREWNKLVGSILPRRRGGPRQPKHHLGGDWIESGHQPDGVSPDRDSQKTPVAR